MHYYLQVMLLSLVCASPLIAQTPVGPIGRQIPVPVEQQDWQARRAQSLKIILAAKAGDPGASSAMNALLAEYETHALSATPMENLDVLGLFYVPRDGVEKCLPAVVLNCALGWYDALRFGSASGRAEIAENEGFFGRAYSLGGGAIQQDAGKFVMENPDKVMKLIEEGLGSAEKSRDTKSYDRRWPTAYGLELIIAAQGGKSEGKILPEGEWDKAWEEAKVRVRTYYGLSESGGSLVSKYFTDPEAASLAEAVASGDTAKIDRMLERGIDLNATGRGGVTPLFWALVKHNKKSFDDLLVHGANPNIQLTEAYGAVGPGNSVMSVAAMNQDIWFLQEVLRHGGDPNLVNSTRS